MTLNLHDIVDVHVHVHVCACTCSYMPYQDSLVPWCSECNLQTIDYSLQANSFLATEERNEHPKLFFVKTVIATPHVLKQAFFYGL